jgi:hypothetical protein
MLAVIDAPLKRWQTPQPFHRTKTWSREKVALAQEPLPGSFVLVVSVV